MHPDEELRQPGAPASMLRFYNVERLQAICPDGIVQNVDLVGRAHGANQAAAQQAFENEIDRNIEANSGLTCNTFTCTDEAARCEFDYVLGDIAVKQLRAPGTKTKKHTITIANGLWEFTTTVSVGCWCIQRA